MYGHQETTTQFLFQTLSEHIVQLPLLWTEGHMEKMQDYQGEGSYNLPQWFSIGLLDTSGQWKPHQMLIQCRIQCRKPKFWYHLGLPQLVVNTKWFKPGLIDTSVCRNSVKCVPLVALCIGIAALDMCRKKGNVSHWNVSSSKANTFPPFHCSLYLTLIAYNFYFIFDHGIHPVSHSKEESRLSLLFSWDVFAGWDLATQPI